MWITRMLIVIVRLLVGATPRWIGSEPGRTQRIYFANHSSHMDTLALWAALPPALREKTHPVAAADYWGKSPFKRYIVLKGLNAVLIDRNHENRDANPLDPLYEILDLGESLIIFPEGTRQFQALPGPFKSGLYHLARHRPEAELIPVYLENLNRSLPKGTFLPLPIICTVRFGAPLQRIPDEDKQAFLDRARHAVTEMAE